MTSLKEALLTCYELRKRYDNTLFVSEDVEVEKVEQCFQDMRTNTQLLIQFLDTDDMLISYTASRTLEETFKCLFYFESIPSPQIQDIAKEIYIYLTQCVLEVKPDSLLSLHAMSFFTNILRDIRKLLNSNDLEDQLIKYTYVIEHVAQDIAFLLSESVPKIVDKLLSSENVIVKTSLMRWMTQVIKFDLFSVPNSPYSPSIQKSYMLYISHLASMFNIQGDHMLLHQKMTADLLLVSYPVWKSHVDICLEFLKFVIYATPTLFHNANVPQAIATPLLLKPLFVRRSYLMFLGNLIDQSLIYLNEDSLDKEKKDRIFKLLLQFFNILSSWGVLNCTDLADTLMEIYSDQDDQLVNMLLIIQSIYCHFEVLDETLLHEIDASFPTVPLIITQQLNPFVLFYKFIDLFQFDHSDLLDLLISSETNFLLYYTSFLKICVSNWELMNAMLNAQRVTDGQEVRRQEIADKLLEIALEKMQSLDLSEKETSTSTPSPLVEGYEHVDEDDDLDPLDPLDHVMSTIIKLRLQMSSLNAKGLLPYNATPLIRLMTSLENFYDETGYLSEKDVMNV